MIVVYGIQRLTTEQRACAGCENAAVKKLEDLMKYCDELEANIQERKQNAESLLQMSLAYCKCH